MKSTEFEITAVIDGRRTKRQDLLATEEPLDIRLASTEGGEPTSIAVTMRTPGNDEELALGFLWSEGIITEPAQIVSVHSSGPIRGDVRPVVVVTVKNLENAAIARASRNFYMTSSCGICGRASIDAIDAIRPFTLRREGVKWLAENISRMPEILRKAQETFEQTGGLHAAGLFGVEEDLRILREDVGRHNAVDKVIGAALREGKLPLSDCLLFVSGRASFELVQKATMAGIPTLAAVGAPSSLAVSLAREVGMTLLGFVRGNRFNIYAGEDRIARTEATDNGI